MKIQSINPSNYQVLGTVDASTPQEIEEKVKLAKKAHIEWKNIGLSQRVTILRKAFDEFKKQKSQVILLQSQEMGMTLGDGSIDFDATIDLVNWYCDNAEKYLSPETTFESDSEIHQVFHEPLGVVAAIIPWNFPFANFVWATVQSLIAGNTVVLKHSEESILNGKLIEAILSQYVPSGVFSEVYGAGDVGKQLIEQDVNMITFTGSTKTGKYLYEVAGKKFVRSVMELGGSAPGILFEDADIELAIGNACTNRLFVQGQCCDGLKRLIVHERIFDEVVEKMASQFSAKKIGNAQDESTQIGPLVAKRQLELLVSQVEDAKTKGAKIITGGNSLEEKLGGAFFEPTVVTNITDDMRIWKEEIFGPVLPIVSFKTEEEAITLANQTEYGLGSYVFTKDTKRAQKVAQAIESGMVSVNGINYLMPFNPFGGYKNSGIGREHGKYGFAEVTQLKIVARSK